MITTKTVRATGGVLLAVLFLCWIAFHDAPALEAAQGWLGAGGALLCFWGVAEGLLKGENRANLALFTLLGVFLTGYAFFQFTS
ncbi:hypothetical protein [Actinocorallia longicatena]|uniref:DUF3953 domain-containing protein n=1 Tax=Actinocorallia longicatena TaxID=111803 RepID=A0ABP6QM84_9ACTN